MLSVSQVSSGSYCSSKKYRKIPKIIKPRGLYFSKALFEGLIFGGAYILRGLSTEGNLRFKLDWASLVVESKFTVFALFYLVFEGNFPSTSPRGAYIWRGDLTEGFLRYRFGVLYLEGLAHGGAYFRNFTVPRFFEHTKETKGYHRQILKTSPNYF